MNPSGPTSPRDLRGVLSVPRQCVWHRVVLELTTQLWTETVTEDSRIPVVGTLQTRETVFPWASALL